MVNCIQVFVFSTSQDPTTHGSKGIFKSINPQNKGKEGASADESWVQDCKNEETKKMFLLYVGKGM